MPGKLAQFVRRMKGASTPDALDGLTYEETRGIDLTKFEIPSRWKPYIAKTPDGTRKLLFRLRPMHHDQRSGGRVFPEEIARENAGPGKQDFVYWFLTLVNGSYIFRPIDQCWANVDHA